MLWHHDITHDDEAIAAADLFQGLEEQVASDAMVQNRPPLVTAGGYEVEVV